MRRRRLPVLLLALTVVAAAVACGSSGRALQDPEPGATAPPRETSTSSSSSPTTKDSLAAFAITTDAWTPAGPLPSRFTCDAEDGGVSPPLSISGVPAGIVELALVVTGGSTSTEWLVTGIDPTTATIAEGTTPPGSVVATNSSGEVGWTSPCPTTDEGTVLYEFALYGLATPSGVTEGMPTEEALELVFAAQIDTTSVLTGTYAR